jgi:methylthioribose-1-phosphate isomerase
MVISATSIYSVIWQDPHLLMINQPRLPREYSYLEVSRCEDVIEAIRTSMVRGEAAGIAAAYGLYLGIREQPVGDRPTFFTQLEAIAQRMQAACPPLLDLSWAIAPLLQRVRETLGSSTDLQQAVLENAKALHSENLRACQSIGEYGLQALPPAPTHLRLLTHANAGALASGGYGTALGIVRSAHAANRLAMLYVTETRPRFQGGRLTAWECVQDELPVTVMADSAAAHWMQQGHVDAVVVGAERIAANGDTANRIGTYSLALVAHAHGIPFYVAAPSFGVDFNRADGSQIPLEERDARDIYAVGDTILCPSGVAVLNPALDITPARLITAIITERGTFAPEDLPRLGQFD